MRRLLSGLLKVLGLGGVLLGLVYGVAALSSGADASVQVFMLLVAAAGGLILFFGVGLLGIGSMVGGKKRKSTATAPGLSPEEQQLRDSRDFQNQGQR